MPKATPNPAAGRGFERAPRGCLIHQRIDLSGAMGIAYERSLAFYKPPHVHDRAILIFPRGGSAMDVTTTCDGRVFRVTYADGLLVPALVEHDDRTASGVYDTFALLPSDALLRAILAQPTQPARSREAVKAFSTCATFRRTPWLDALLSEYFAERVPEPGRSSSARSAHLEALILFEVNASIEPQAVTPRDAKASKPIAGPPSLVARALRFLEANLFAPVDLERLAIATGASRSSLLRHFRAHTGATPLAYVRARRLDEAEALLGRAEHSVSEVARLVGYTNLAAFSDAYRARFGAPPSQRARAR